MKRILINFLILSATLFAAIFCYALGPLDISETGNWKIEYIGQDEKISYKLINDEDKKSILLLFPGIVTDRAELEERNFKVIALNQLLMMENKYREKHKNFQYETISISGIRYNGFSLVLNHNTDFFQSHIILTNGVQIWDGLFNGSEQHWKEVVEMLRKM